MRPTASGIVNTNIAPKPNQLSSWKTAPPRVEENRLDVEDDEENRNHVELDRVTAARADDLRLTAFERLLFLVELAARPEQQMDAEHRARNHHPHDEDHQNAGVLGEHGSRPPSATKEGGNS